ncbi:MAG: PBP1A family penicillin-binding protein [Deferribacteres bacterium]|nr:PBP1A family penicillin-binding protein [candidate division KSB1 bacterium]MCB9502440.1 PBP1A family penicillin-binding protein [Deferribacteres bacterium]
MFLVSGLPSLSTLEDYKPSLASKVYSRNLELIHEFYYQERRTYTPIEEMPPYLWQAVVSIEDRRFFEHWGLDPIRNIKAIVVNIIALGIEEGASTLTQQLARQLYMEQSLQKTFTRKLREQITAVEIERTYTKREILDIYLNYMNFGHGSYGVHAAAKFYFDKDARKLNIQECALLAGLLQRPASLSPYVNPERALRRRNLVLAAMHKMEFINDEEYEAARESDLGILPEKPTKSSGIAPYFVEYIRQELGKRYGMDLYKAGLKIYTTLDTRAQFFAEKYSQKQIDVMQRKSDRRLQKDLKELEKLIPQSVQEELGKSLAQIARDTVLVDSLLTERLPIQMALISIEPKTGHILAMIGGRDFEKYKFNRATQAERQPGSAFKPFLYTAVIDNDYSPTLELLNQPVVVFLENGQRWSPHNYGETMGGLTSIREGLMNSLNLISVRLIQEITNPLVVLDYAKKMGITTKIPAVDAIALGAGSVIPIEITSAYSAFANQGVRMEPIAVIRVEDQFGNILEENIPQGKEVLRKSTAYIMTDMLRSVVTGGTGARSRWLYKFYRPAAGKTGTTNDYTDAWFVGFTPQIATGVWFGFDNPAQQLGEGQTGTNVALPVWGPYMKAAHDTLGLPEEDFIMPDDVVRVKICKESKELASPECPDPVDEIFRKEFAPQKICETHSGTQNRSNRRRRIR